MHLLIVRIERHTINSLINCIFQFQLKYNLLCLGIYFCHACTTIAIAKHIAHSRTN